MELEHDFLIRWERTLITDLKTIGESSMAQKILYNSNRNSSNVYWYIENSRSGPSLGDFSLQKSVTQDLLATTISIGILTTAVHSGSVIWKIPFSSKDPNACTVSAQLFAHGAALTLGDDNDPHSDQHGNAARADRYGLHELAARANDLPRPGRRQAADAAEPPAAAASPIKVQWINNSDDSATWYYRSDVQDNVSDPLPRQKSTAVKVVSVVNYLECEWAVSNFKPARLLMKIDQAGIYTFTLENNKQA